jgi:hypothetical protein
MASTIPAFDCDFLSDRGEKELLIGVTTKVRDVVSNTDVATVVTNSVGQFPATGVAGAVGTRYRIRIEHDGFGRAGYIEMASE